MKKTKILIVFASLMFTGCAATNNSGYRWVKDSEKIDQVERMSMTSPYAVKTIWVNPPRKKVKTDEEK
ncbi:hypothetical protein [Aliikangiella coralliicola]|uniref:Uncharacterized protein n=1 Tax=Aliikangiella coralliicola TaxID=2592383 RepID=A0A545U8K1_9GAMM|nr:hypothetical protein [Aliikangiella coralliicola]TQV85792.1 hypothetical protein FLL46_17865 [Aliikangiella coralliicola]